MATLRVRVLGGGLVLRSLVAHLERAGCLVVQAGPDLLEARIPDAPSGRQARRELSLYLDAWRALHPQAGILTSWKPDREGP